MKNVVVVIEAEKAILFSGEELKVSNNPDGVLYVKDMKAQETIAVFQKENWLYWFEHGERLAAIKDITVGRLMIGKLVAQKKKVCQHCAAKFVPAVPNQRFCDKHRT